MDTTLTDTDFLYSTEVVGGAADTVERRLSLRLLDHWRELGKNGTLPAPEKVEPGHFADLWSNCFLIDVPANGAPPVFRAAGEAFDAWAGGNVAGTTVDALPQGVFPGSTLDIVGEVVRKGVPITRGGETTDGNGTTLLYRSIILPLSDNGNTVTGLLGGLTCREIVAD